MGISGATFYKWRQTYPGVGPSELRRTRQLEEENRKLKQIVADLSLDKAMLKHIVAKKSRFFAAQGVGARFNAMLRPIACSRTGH